MQVWSLGQEDPLEEGKATHSSILALRIPQTEETSMMQSIGSQRVGHDWSTLAWTMWVYIFYFLDYLWDEFYFCFILLYTYIPITVDLPIYLFCSFFSWIFNFITYFHEFLILSKYCSYISYMYYTNVYKFRNTCKNDKQ